MAVVRTSTSTGELFAPIRVEGIGGFERALKPQKPGARLECTAAGSRELLFETADGRPGAQFWRQLLV